MALKFSLGNFYETYVSILSRMFDEFSLSVSFVADANETDKTFGPAFTQYCNPERRIFC